MARRTGGGVLVMDEGLDSPLTSGEVAQYLGISPYKARLLMGEGLLGEVFTTDDEGNPTYPSVRYGAVLAYTDRRGTDADDLIGVGGDGAQATAVD